MEGMDEPAATPGSNLAVRLLGPPATTSTVTRRLERLAKAGHGGVFTPVFRRQRDEALGQLSIRRAQPRREVDYWGAYATCRSLAARCLSCTDTYTHPLLTALRPA